ncbi:hypothetical protein [Dyadobacter sp. CY356]|uniref:hypothetical protein n=1 Tax=Dyadobacter sp. CY356 TaxID=2906442 RepID=UPI001F22FBA5|nr:hypothetical protein [Dyadobacter sp. CY356]MCF0059280.1 hypothetical protein [Dyadobacter sp. CY356]
MEEKFKVELLPDAVSFLNKLDERAREKVYYNIKKSQFMTNSNLLKKLTGNIWEFRTLYNQQI